MRPIDLYELNRYMLQYILIAFIIICITYGINRFKRSRNNNNNININYPDKNNLDNLDNLDNFDNLNDSELLTLIKNFGRKKMIFDKNTFSTLTKHVAIKNNKILPLTFEYMHKIKDIEFPLKIVKTDKKTKPRFAKKYFSIIKPDFDSKYILDMKLENYDIYKYESNNMTINDYLFNEYFPLISFQFNNNMISYEEYENSFKDPNNKADYMNMSKKILKYCNNKNKLKFIRAFNKIC